MKNFVRIKESEFLKQVIDLAHLLGWKVAHFRTALSQSGRWLTAVQGDGKGFPDLIMVRGERVVAAELKVGYKKMSVEQEEWRLAFAQTPIEAFCWYPRDWDTIVKVLE